MKRASSYGMKPFPMVSSDVEIMPRQNWGKEKRAELQPDMACLPHALKLRALCKPRNIRKGLKVYLN